MYEVKIFTLYPEFFPGPLAGGIYGKAMSSGLWSLKAINIRDYADDKHKTVDDTLFGGGSGMLMKPDVVAKSIDKNITQGEKIFYLSHIDTIISSNTILNNRPMNSVCSEGIAAQHPDVIPARACSRFAATPYPVHRSTLTDTSIGCSLMQITRTSRRSPTCARGGPSCAWAGCSPATTTATSTRRHSCRGRDGRRILFRRSTGAAGWAGGAR